MLIELDGTVYMAMLKDEEYGEIHKMDNTCIELEYTGEPIEAVSEITANFKPLISFFNMQKIKNHFKAYQLSKIFNRTKKFRIKKKLANRINELLN